MRVEGYWRERGDTKSNLPWPEPCTDAIWPLIRQSFFTRLSHLELEKARRIYYRGRSICRLCPLENGKVLPFVGSVEYELDGWRWPEGFIHYVGVHCVAPSFDFWKFVVENTLDLMPKSEHELAIVKRREFGAATR